MNIGKQIPSLTIKGSSYLFIKRHDGNSYTAQLEETKLLTTHNPAIQISDCSNFKPVATAFRKPFKVFLDGSAQFKSIKVSKDDVDLSIAIKFFLASLLQANKQKLQEQTASGNEFSFDDNTLTHLGKCDVKNKGSKVGEQSYKIEQSVNRETCKVFESPAYKNDKQYVDSICVSPSKQRKSTFASYKVINVNFKDEKFTTSGAKDISSVPQKNSPFYLTTDYKTFLHLNPLIPSHLIKRKGSSRDPEPFNDDNSKEITELQYINIDKNIMVQEPESYDTENILILFKALACDPLKNNMNLAFIRETVKCMQK